MLFLQEQHKPSTFQDVGGLSGDAKSSFSSLLNTLILNINYNDSCFPIFPTDDNVTDYAKYMRRTLKATEEWVFHQCFFCKNYYKIPEGFTTLAGETPKPEKSEKLGDKKKQLPLSTLKYVELLITLAGPDICKYIPIRYIIHAASKVWMFYTYYYIIKNHIA